MISVKSFVIERAVDFITASVTNTVFTSSFPRFSMTSLIVTKLVFYAQSTGTVISGRYH